MTFTFRNIGRYKYFIGALIIATGILLRFTEWFHQRDLMMDEVNVVRNIFERNITGLLTQLDYEQFAPPLFLWITKLNGWLFGYSELSMRLFPILCSCTSLVLFFKWLRQAKCIDAFWYPLALFAFSEIYILYGNDVKQYASDTLITILLSLLAWNEKLLLRRSLDFFVVWLIAGCVSIWLSMPSIFILSGVGIGIFLKTLKYSKPRLTFMISMAGVGWGLCFLLYYNLLLKDQIGSTYLHNFHQPYFLKVPSLKELFSDHNVQLLRNIFSSLTGSDNIYLIYINLLLLLLGFIRLFHKNTINGIMILIPVLATLVAAGLESFTLIPRVCLFLMPVMLFIIGNGLQLLISSGKIFVVVLIPTCLFSIITAQQFHLFQNRIEIDEFTTATEFALEHKVPIDRIYLHELYKPVYIYYTEIHPDKQRASLYQKIQILGWSKPLAEVREQIKGRAAFIYFWIDDNTIQKHKDSIFNFLQPVAALEKSSYKSLVFERR